MHTELFEELKEKGFEIKPGQLGENISTQGIDLLNLPKDSILKIGSTAKIKITGLRNPCKQIDLMQKDLLKAVLEKIVQVESLIVIKLYLGIHKFFRDICL